MKIHLSEWQQELLLIGILSIVSFLFFPIEGLILWPIAIIYLFLIFKIVKLLVRSLVLFYSKRQVYAMLLFLLVNIACITVCWLFPLTILGTPFQYIEREESIKKGVFLGDYQLVDSPLPVNIFKDHCTAWVQYSCFYENYSEKLRGNLIVNKQAYDMCISFSNLHDLIPNGYFKQWKLWHHETRQIDNLYCFEYSHNIQDSITLEIFNMNDSCIGELVFVRCTEAE